MPGRDPRAPQTCGRISEPCSVRPRVAAIARSRSRAESIACRTWALKRSHLKHQPIQIVGDFHIEGGGNGNFGREDYSSSGDRCLGEPALGWYAKDPSDRVCRCSARSVSLWIPASRRCSRTSPSRNLRGAWKWHSGSPLPGSLPKPSANSTFLCDWERSISAVMATLPFSAPAAAADSALSGNQERVADVDGGIHRGEFSSPAAWRGTIYQTHNLFLPPRVCDQPP